MSAAIRAGKAFVELFLKDVDFNKSLDNAKAKLKSFAAAAINIGSSMAYAGAAMLGPLTLATKAAGDLQETMSKLNAVFGDQAQGTIAWMDQFTAAVGRSKKETADALSSFQAFFVGMGLEADQAAQLSKSMVELAVDFGSFHNVSDPESAQRMISALSGSSEVLDMFGINIKAAALDLKLLEMGFPKVAGGASELQKVLARQSIIKDSMGKQGAIGDAIRTASSFSNTTKALTAQLMDMVAKIGTAVMPIFADWMQSISRGVTWLSSFVTEHGELLRIVTQVAGALTLLGGVILIVGKTVAIAVTAFTTLRKAIVAIGAVTVLMTPLVASLVAVGVVLGTVGYAMGVFGNSIGEVSHAMEEQAGLNAKARSEDELRMKRLEQLAEKETLNSEQMTEANQLIAILTNRYGDLGLSIDGVTGKIVGMTDAQKKLTDLMKQKQLIDLEAQANEAEFNVRKLKAERADWHPGSLNYTRKSLTKGGREEIASHREGIRSGMSDERDRAANLRAQIAALKAGNADPTAGNDIAETARKAAADDAAKKQAEAAREDTVKAAGDAQTDLAKIEDDRRRATLAQLDRDIEDAQRAGEERKRLIDAVFDGELAREGGPNPGAMLDLVAKKNAVDPETEADIAAIRKKAADEEAQRVEEATRAQTDEIAMKQLELKYAAQAGETEAQASEREHEKRMEMIELERKQALAGIKDGLDPALLNQRFDLEKNLAEAEFNAQGMQNTEQKFNSVGSFSADVVGRLGQDSIQKKQLSVQEKSMDLLAKIEKKEGGLAFGNEA